MRLVALFALVLALVSFPGIAVACGAFAGPPAPTDNELVGKLPYLTVEQVLLVWDKETQTEDFVREARFAKSNQTFGFVVPAPTKPEVAAVKDPPWDRLRAALPFQEDTPARPGSAGGHATGAIPASAPPPVEVLSQQRVGSFTAFTLATTDAGAFDKWLKDNGLAMTKEARPWLEHYVRLKFFFVAFRYEASDAGSDEMTSETVRIRFKTPNPYYPYMEPAHAPNAPRPTTRRLSGWFVTSDAMVAVAARPTSRPRFGRPWELGRINKANSKQLTDILGPSLSSILPQSGAELFVQAFRDQKVSRARYGDVVLVPSSPATFAQPDIDARRFLLGVVDPVVLGEPDQEPAVEDNPLAATPTASASPARACSAAPAPGSGGGFPAILCLGALGACLAIRRRAFLAFALMGCRVTPSAPADAAPPVTSASATPPSPADRERIALDVLAGKTPAEGISLDVPYDQGLTPHVQLAPSLAVEGGVLPSARQVLSAQIPRVRLCYARDLEGNSAEHGELTLVLRVAADGSVANVQAMNEGAFQPSLVLCVRGVLAKTKFEAPGNDLTIKPTYQLTTE